MEIEPEHSEITWNIEEKDVWLGDLPDYEKFKANEGFFLLTLCIFVIAYGFQNSTMFIGSNGCQNMQI